MLLYSTILGINRTMMKDAFIRLIIKWNQGSPHEENIIKGISWNGEKNVRFGDDKLWMEIIEYRNKNIIAVRYEKISDDGAIWDTDYIMNFDEMRMAIRLDRSYVEEAVVTNAEFSTPHFITLLIENGYLYPDGNLEVLRDAIDITDDNIALLTNVITGKVKYQLPVVYVSKTVFNKDPLSVRWLCSRLKGVAHVLLQQDKKTNGAIRSACNDLNEYNGAVGIYYPNDVLGHKRCVFREGAEKQLLERVVNHVLQYGVLQRTDRLYTWQGVSNSLLNDRLASQRSERLEAERAREKAENDRIQAESARYKAEKARDKAECEVEDVYASLDEELNALQRQVDELSRANEIKENENQALRARLAQIDDKPVLIQGEEEDLFAGEIKDFVLEAINEKLSKARPDSRRAHILRDIIESNRYEKLVEKMEQEIKRLFKGYNGMTSSIKRSLQSLGFTISEEGKHYKLKFGDDSRYMVTVSKTPSDHREGENTAATICRMLF